MCCVGRRHTRKGPDDREHDIYLLRRWLIEANVSDFGFLTVLACEEYYLLSIYTNIKNKIHRMEAVKDTTQKIASAVNGALANGTSNGQTLLVTGASGFLAAHILNEFLDHGYHVRGTVRSEETAAKVRKTHAKYGDKLSFAIVKDVAEPGAFDEAVKGVDGVWDCQFDLTLRAGS